MQHPNVALFYFGYDRKMLVCAVADVFTASNMQTLELSSLHLCHHAKNKKFTVQRRTVKSYNFGYWDAYSPEIFKTKNTEEVGLEFSRWLALNDPLLVSVEQEFIKLFPSLHTQAKHIPQSFRPFKIWTTATINISHSNGMPAHKDLKDWKDGYCAVITFGNYQGGQLHFPELNITVQRMKYGITFFKSAQLLHEVQAFTGSRGSLVLFTHNSVLNKFLL